MKPPPPRVIHPKDVLTGGFEIFALKAHHKRLTLRFMIPDGLPPLLTRSGNLIGVGGADQRTFWYLSGDVTPYDREALSVYVLERTTSQKVRVA